MSLVTAMTVVALLGMVATVAAPRPRPPIADVARNEGATYCQDGDLLITVLG